MGTSDPMEIRKIIYTTNAIESLNSSIRKYTKTKSVFPDDQSSMKAVYLSVNIIQQKWNMPIRSWGIILNQFIIKFGHRCQIWVLIGDRIAYLIDLISKCL